jgi:glyoxylase-like metal-dependent hydrolase (beta-lactamase superfamily II)
VRIERIPVEAGGPEGTNSAYALPDCGLLVDPGPPGEAAWEELRAGLEEAAIALGSIDHVVCTHWHADHIGLAARVETAADATIHMHERDTGLLASYAVARERRLDRDRSAMARWGVPADLAAAVIDRDRPSALPETTAVVAHGDGSTIADTGARVLHTPGHTAGHLALVVDEHLFVGDTVLPMYTANVGGSDPRLANPLDAFLRSLARIDRQNGIIHPGHGTSAATIGRIAAIRDHHRARSLRVFETVERLGEPTPWDVATELFGEMRGIHAKFGAGEAAAHLAFLAAQDDLSRREASPTRFALASDPDAGPSASI